MIKDRRTHPIKRTLGSLAMRDGAVVESKIFSTIGKFLCIWLILKHADDLISHEEALFILLAFLVLPDLVKKLLEMRFGRNTTTGETGHHFFPLAQCNQR